METVKELRDFLTTLPDNMPIVTFSYHYGKYKTGCYPTIGKRVKKLTKIDDIDYLEIEFWDYAEDGQNVLKIN